MECAVELLDPIPQVAVRLSHCILIAVFLIAGEYRCTSSAGLLNGNGRTANPIGAEAIHLYQHVPLSPQLLCLGRKLGIFHGIDLLPEPLRLIGEILYRLGRLHDLCGKQLGDLPVLILHCRQIPEGPPAGEHFHPDAAVELFH